MGPGALTPDKPLSRSCSIHCPDDNHGSGHRSGIRGRERSAGHQVSGPDTRLDEDYCAHELEEPAVRRTPPHGALCPIRVARSSWPDRAHAGDPEGHYLAGIPSRSREVNNDSLGFRGDHPDQRTNQLGREVVSVCHQLDRLSAQSMSSDYLRIPSGHPRSAGRGRSGTGELLLRPQPVA